MREYTLDSNGVGSEGELVELIRWAGRVPGGVLEDVDLSGVNLDATNFSECVVQNVIFSNCSLRATKWGRGSVWACLFRGADLTFADFREAEPFKCDFEDARLQDVMFSPTWNPLTCWGSDPRYGWNRDFDGLEFEQVYRWWPIKLNRC